MVHCKCFRIYTCKNCSTTMKFILALSVVLTVSVILCNASCSYRSLTLAEARKAVCVSNGKTYKINSTWKEGCDDCSCSKSGLQCCNNVKKPVSFDKETCESIYIEETCSYKVTKKDNPSVECPVKAMTG